MENSPMTNMTPRRTRLSPSGRPVTRPADKPDALPGGIGHKQDVGDLWYDSMRGVDIGSDELALVESILSGPSGGTDIARIASLTERARRAERRTLVRELTPETVLAEQVAEARADERRRVEREAAEDCERAAVQIRAEHAAELARLKAAWSVVSGALAG
jgi:hypothetical protein